MYFFKEMTKTTTYKNVLLVSKASVWYYCLESNFMTSEEQWTEKLCEMDCI